MPEPTPSEPPSPDSTDSPNSTNLHDTIVSELKAWPDLFLKLITQPRKGSAEMPRQGSWLRPLVYSAASGVVSGLLYAIWMLRFPGMAVTMFIRTVVLSVVGVFVGGAILNVILAAVSKDPGLYRTVLIAGVLSALSVAAVILTVATLPLLSWIPAAVGLYVLFYYVQACAGFTKKQAWILVGVLAAVGLLPLLGMTWFAHRAMLPYGM